VKGNFPARGAYYFFEPEGELLPFFQRHRLALDLSTGQVKWIDQATATERWTLNLRLTRLLPYLNDNADRNLAIRYGVIGHLVILNLGFQVCALDPVDRRVVWQKNVLDRPLVPERLQINFEGPLTLQMVYIDESGATYHRPLGSNAPFGVDHVCLTTPSGLTALDPLTGQTLWRRTGKIAESDLFGDEDYLYQSGPLAPHALRARDGAAVTVAEFPASYPSRQAAFGSSILLLENEGATGARLRLYDLRTGKDLWKKSVSANAKVLRSEDPRLSGVVEPDGAVVVVDLETHQEVLRATLDSAHLDQVQEIYVLRDRRHIYLACNGPFKVAGAILNRAWANLPGGLRTIPVNGMVYAFEPRHRRPPLVQPRDAANPARRAHRRAAGPAVRRPVGPPNRDGRRHDRVSSVRHAGNRQSDRQTDL